MANQIIEVVGLTANNHNRSCTNHHCCGECLVLGAPNNGVGMRLRLCLTPQHELACHIICNDDTNGCCVGYTFAQFAIDHGAALNGAVIEISDVYTQHSSNSAERSMFWQNRGYALARVI